MFSLYLIIFLLIAFPGLYFIGRPVLSKISSQTSPLEKLFLSIIFGIVFIVFETLITSFLKIRFLSLPLIVFLVLISIFKYRQDFSSSISTLFKSKILVFMILLSIIILGMINFPSGIKSSNGLNFFSSQGHDGLWHVSLMEEIKVAFPPFQPLYANHPLTNYHFISDIFMGEFYRLFPFLNALDLYFRFYPILFAFLISLGVYNFVFRLKNHQAAIWAMFFTSFCGSFGYIYAIIKNQFIFSGETTFWASQGNTILGNPPHALGIILLTTILLLLTLFQKFENKNFLYLLLILALPLAGVKASSGVISVVGLLAVGLLRFILEKKKDLGIIGVLVAIGNFLTLKIISPTAESFIIFNPLWFPHTMMVVRLDNVDWELRRQHYASLHTLKAFIRLIIHEAYAITIFIVGNTGIRLLGLFEAVKVNFKKISYPYVFMQTGILASVLVVLLFVQNGITYNHIQYIQIYLHFMGIFAGITMAFIIEKIKNNQYKIIFSTIIIALAVPTVIGNLFDFYGPGKKPLSFISNQEIDALSWIKNNTNKDAVIFTKPFDKDAHYGYTSHPLPISAWYSTMYVHSISTRRTFLTGEEQLTITGYKIEEDIKNMKKFMMQDDVIFGKNYLTKNNIDYLYFRKKEIENTILIDKIGLSRVYENQEVIVYKNENK
ncbi:MAG TPA: hypothetical protein VLH94_00220 [Spirochaetia bacterium]|nr:hypothetical protein [Spirochaetia bacterium]